MTQAEDANLLGPLVVDESLIRLLRSSIGPRVAQIGQPKSGVQRVADAVSWIPLRATHHGRRDGGVGPHEGDVLPPVFQSRHLNEPLQYQKVLRLHEARRLMLCQNVEATDLLANFIDAACALLRQKSGRFEIEHAREAAARVAGRISSDSDYLIAQLRVAGGIDADRYANMGSASSFAQLLTRRSGSRVHIMCAA